MSKKGTCSGLGGRAAPPGGTYRPRFRLATLVVVAAALSACGGDGGGGGGTPAGPGEIRPEKNVASLEPGTQAVIEVTAVDGRGNPVPFTARSSGLCASVSAGASSITVAAGTSLCSETVTIEAGTNLSKAITINVVDPATMDIGEGLLIKYVDQYTWRWNDVNTGGSTDVTFYHPDAGGNGWYPLGSYVRPGYADPNSPANSYPMVLVKASRAADVLAAPTGYQAVWTDSGSGGTYDGSVWKPTCPVGFKALGVVVQSGYAAPSTEDVRCVREDFTAPAAIGALVYTDSGTGASQDLGVWQIGTPQFPTRADDRAPLPAGTMVGCPGYSTASCDLGIVNLLLVPTPVHENGEDTVEPMLTGFTNLDTSRPKFFSSVRLPFTLIPSVKNDQANSHRNVTLTPFYFLQRQEHYVSLSALDNRQSTTATPLTYTTISTFDATEVSTFSQTVGLSVTVGGEASFLGSGGSWEVTLSAELGWEQSRSTSYGMSSGTAVEFTVPAGAFAEIVQVKTQFQAIDALGIPVGPPLAAGQNTVKYLQYPR
jgi:hypothetical protein